MPDPASRSTDAPNASGATPAAERGATAPAPDTAPDAPPDRPPRRAAGSLALAAALVIAVTALHYQTAVHLHGAHGIYRRLYYFPIIIAAFAAGWRGGLLTALAACALYYPHARGWIGFDPAPALEKALEMVLYVAVGLVTGVLVSRESRTRLSLWRTTIDLRRSLEEQARMEAELVRQARLAAVGRLSAGLAHEIRNPLASIRGAAEVLQDDFPAEHPKGRLLGVLMKETARLNAVLSRFLDFARPRALRRESLDLAQTLTEMAELVRHQAAGPGTGTGTGAEPRTAEVRTRIEGAGPWLTAADPSQIRQLLLNVLLNALQASAAAGAGEPVRAVLRAAGDRLAVVVEDRGAGFTPEARDNLGTPFFTTREGGTGLGLAISRRIAEDHGGELRVADRPGGGAAVTIELPRSD